MQVLHTNTAKNTNKIKQVMLNVCTAFKVLNRFFSERLTLEP